MQNVYLFFNAFILVKKMMRLIYGNSFFFIYI